MQNLGLAEARIELKKTRFGSYLVGQMPDGCRLCTMGAKLVLFVTGLCNKACFYCPLSPERKHRDISLANERPVRRLEDITEEAMLMDALGTGLTGGDPLLRPDRTVKYIELLKREFGRDITFWGGGCDTQYVLPRGTPQEVEAEVQRRVEELASGGGFVFCPVHNIQPDVPPENIVACYHAARA